MGHTFPSVIISMSEPHNQTSFHGPKMRLLHSTGLLSQKMY